MHLIHVDHLSFSEEEKILSSRQESKHPMLHSYTTHFIHFLNVYQNAFMF